MTGESERIPVCLKRWRTMMCAPRCPIQPGSRRAMTTRSIVAAPFPECALLPSSLGEIDLLTTWQICLFFFFFLWYRATLCPIMEIPAILFAKSVIRGIVLTVISKAWLRRLSFVGFVLFFVDILLTWKNSVLLLIRGWVYQELSNLAAKI